MSENPAAQDNMVQERQFIEDLAKRLKDARGRAAELRRNAGNSIAESRSAGWFFSLLGARPIARLNDGSLKGEEAYFLVATLFASDKDAIDGKNKFAGDFGATLIAYRNNKYQKDTGKSFDRRFNVLLDADFDPQFGGDLAYRLRQMTKQVIALKDPAVRIDWARLLYDVKHWNSDKKYVQKNWARSYYAPSDDSPKNNTSESNTQE